MIANPLGLRNGGEGGIHFPAVLVQQPVLHYGVSPCAIEPAKRSLRAAFTYPLLGSLAGPRPFLVKIVKQQPLAFQPAVILNECNVVSPIVLGDHLCWFSRKWRSSVLR